MAEEQEALKREASGRSDVGVVARGAGQTDEDSLCVREFEDGQGGLYAVADGLRQRSAGSVASAQAVGLFEEAMEAYARHGQALLTQLGPQLGSLKEYMRYVAGRIDTQLQQNAESNPSLTGMATTLTAAYVDDGKLLLAHIGDSRAYKTSAGAPGLRRLTSDDSPAPGGEFDPEPTEALGSMSAEALHVDEYAVEDGDILLLCTDGLWRELDDALIERILRGSPRPTLAVERLIRAANQSGGRGNMSVIVVHFGEPDLTNDESIDSAYPPAGAPLPGQDRNAPFPMPRTEAEAEEQEPGSVPGVEPAEVEAEAPAAPPAEAADLPLPTPEATPEEPVEPTEEPAEPTSEEAPAIPGPPSGGYQAVPEVTERETYPRPADADEPAAVRPRRQQRSQQEGTSGPALFFIGLAAGVVIVLVIGGIVWGLRTWLGGPEPEAPATEVAEATMQYDEITTHPFSFWARNLGADGRPCMVLYKSLHEDTGEESWEELDRLRGDATGPSGSVTLFREGDTLHMFLDVQFVADDTGSPRDCIFSIKVMPNEEGGREISVQPGADAGDQAGDIEVRADAPGTVTLVPRDPDEHLLADGALEFRLGGDRNAEGYYVREITDVPLGTYTIRKGDVERQIDLTESHARFMVNLSIEAAP